MEKRELQQLYHLNREIDHNKERLAELEAAATAVTLNVSGLPHVSAFANKTAIAAEIADLKNEIEAKTMLCIVEYNRIMRYIYSIDDSYMRQVMSLRHVNGFSWAQVAAHIGGGNTADSVRMAHNRFLQNR